MMEQKCMHKGCGKKFTDPDEDCVYHSGPPVFHEGQKGWQCCKPRVLTFDEFLDIPPCTTGKHSTIDDTPKPEKKPVDESLLPQTAPLETRPLAAVPRIPTTAPTTKPPAPPPQEDTEDDDPTLAIPEGKTCRRKACGATYHATHDRSSEQCVSHPGVPIFHEGTKGYTCCKKRVLEFDEFLNLAGCTTKPHHLFIGSGGKSKSNGAGAEDMLDTVRTDFYQTSMEVIASYYLKKIEKAKSSVQFADEHTLKLDLLTTDGKRYKADVPLYGAINPSECSFKIMGTKLELTLVKKDGAGWPVLRADDRLTGEIIQAGRAGSLR